VEVALTPRIRVAHVATIDLTLRFLLLGQMRRLRDEGFDVTAISAPGPWAAEVEEEGIRHIPWRNATRAWNPSADVAAFLELRRIFARESFHLVHTHNPKPGILGRIAARAAGVPCVFNTVHGLYATRSDPALKRLAVLGAEALASRFSDLELYQSGEDLAWARAARVVRSPATSVLLGNGIDLDRFDPSAVPPGRTSALRRELGIPEGAVVVGTVGRMVAEKGYREFFAAARVVRRADPNVRFLAVGSSDVAKADAIGEREIARASEDVVFAGWRRDVGELLGAMDVFVLPSWREGIPRSAMEAAAMGVASVLTDIRGCREVARHGREALLVPPRDAGRLAAAIGLLAHDDALRERLGRAARTRAIEHFDERTVGDIVVAAYRDVLRAKRIVGGLARPEPMPASRRDPRTVAPLPR
jgi:glycosyltransferase involved in cell wall biosynthesis